MKSFAFGFPRLGKNREYKFAIEGFWRGEISEDKLINALSELQKENIKIYKGKVDFFPEGEISFYDPMLDIAILCGLYNPKDLVEYYKLCRGKNALELTKWFNTNYHYLVTDFRSLGKFSFRLNLDNVALKFKKCDFPNFIGPFTFLKLSKGIPKSSFRNFFLLVVEVYKEIILNYKKVLIEEPAFVMDIEKDEIELIREGYEKLAEAGKEIWLLTYYDSIDFMGVLINLPLSAIGIDFVRGRKSYEYILEKGFPEDKILIAGLVDGRNVWKNDVKESVNMLNKLSQKVPNIIVSNASPLYHLPVSLSKETHLDQRLKRCLAFAEEKLDEISLICKCYDGIIPFPKKVSLRNYGKNRSVQKRIKSLKENDFIKSLSYKERRKKQEEILKLPLFPTTTIGSFPQTDEIRKKRVDYLNEKITEKEYKEFIYKKIDELIEFQEEVGIDVFVHGEFERSDMVEFFAQRLSGIATTQHGWIISYGTRVYRPPIIYGDISRTKPMTIDEIYYAQSKTNKPVKGMLTGPVTIIAWSYCREDIPLRDIAYQIALCLRDEILDYEKIGIKIVQIDEPAFREKAYIKRKDWEDYFEWAIKAFNLATNTNPFTQIHTHMCYSEFGEIIDYIKKLNFDVISIESARSKGDLIESIYTIGIERQVGFGIWDVHSPDVPTIEDMLEIERKALQKIPKENIWLNPDCGLKTRDWPETKKALKNLVEVAKKLRKGDY